LRTRFSNVWISESCAFDVGALLDQVFLCVSSTRRGTLELRPLVASGSYMSISSRISDSGAQALAAQGELQAGCVARRVDPPLACAARRDQPLVFVEADGARRDVELAGRAR
jgi:hypothetical protein